MWRQREQKVIQRLCHNYKAVQQLAKWSWFMRPMPWRIRCSPATRLAGAILRQCKIQPPTGPAKQHEPSISNWGNPAPRGKISPTADNDATGAVWRQSTRCRPGAVGAPFWRHHKSTVTRGFFCQQVRSSGDFWFTYWLLESSFWTESHQIFALFCILILCRVINTSVFFKDLQVLKIYSEWNKQVWIRSWWNLRHILGLI